MPTDAQGVLQRHSDKILDRIGEPLTLAPANGPAVDCSGVYRRADIEAGFGDAAFVAGGSDLYFVVTRWDARDLHEGDIVTRRNTSEQFRVKSRPRVMNPVFAYVDCEVTS